MLTDIPDAIIYYRIYSECHPSCSEFKNPRDIPLWSDGGAASQVFVENVFDTSHFLGSMDERKLRLKLCWSGIFDSLFNLE